MLKRKEKAHKLEEKKGFSFYLFRLFFLILSINLLNPGNSSFAEESYNFQKTNTLETNQPEIKETEPSNKLDLLEEKVFNQKYPGESKEQRVERLEGLIFGTKQKNPNIENRIDKLYEALQPSNKEETKTTLIQLENQKLAAEAKQAEIRQEKEEPKILYDETFNTGVLGTINQIETRLFNKTFSDIPFHLRVEKLEEKLLSKREIIKTRTKSLLERVSYLVKESEVKPANIQQPQRHQTYTIDPQTGYLINEQTREIIKDNYGNPIIVKIPQLPPEQTYIQPQYPLPPGQYGQNPYLPYGNPLQQGTAPGQLPLDYLFDRQNFPPQDQEY